MGVDATPRHQGLGRCWRSIHGWIPDLAYLPEEVRPGVARLCAISSSPSSIYSLAPTTSPGWTLTRFPHALHSTIPHPEEPMTFSCCFRDPGVRKKVQAYHRRFRRTRGGSDIRKRGRASREGSEAPERVQRYQRGFSHTRKGSEIPEKVQTHKRGFRHTRGFGHEERIQTYQKGFRGTREGSDVPEGVRVYWKRFRRPNIAGTETSQYPGELVPSYKNVMRCLVSAAELSRSHRRRARPMRSAGLR